MKQNMSSRAERADFFHSRSEWRHALSKDLGTIWEAAARPLFAAIILLFLSASGFLASCSVRPADILAITHVTIVDMTGAPPRADQTIILRKGASRRSALRMPSPFRAARKSWTRTENF
jgi:hypothetical protein